MHREINETAQSFKFTNSVRFQKLWFTTQQIMHTNNLFTQIYKSWSAQT